MERRALGKGLEALLSEQADLSMVREVQISQIVPNPYQPRRTFETQPLNDLAESIRQIGVLQPIIVRQVAHDSYELVAGERRLRASELAGKTTIPAIVRSADSQAMLELALIENLQREDINPVDSAIAYKKLLDEFGLTHEQIAERLGKSRVAITNTLRLLHLPERALLMLETGKITEGHAKALLSVRDEVDQNQLLDAILENSLSVRETERWARNRTQPKKTDSLPPDTKSSSSPGVDANWRAIEQMLAEFFGTRVQLQRSSIGGKMTIEFYGEEDLNRILELLKLS